MKLQKLRTRLGAAKLRLAAFLMAATAATGALAATPVADVVWESDFSSSKTGTDNNTYSITLNGNTVNSDGNLVINNSANSYKGASISLTDTKTAATVLIKYSSLAAYSTANATLANIASASYGVGARSSSAGQLGLTGFYNESSSTYGFSSTPTLVAGSGYFLLGYSYDTGTIAYAGSSLSSMTGGNTTSLRFSSFPIATISVGGGVATSRAYAWNGVVIEKVAIFFGAYSATDLADYEFPGDEANKTALAAWIDDNRSIYAWRAPATGTGNFHQSNISVVNDDGSVNPSIAMDGTGGANYLSFASGKTQYTAPGHVLCFDKAGYKASTDASFTPLSFGGLYVNALGANDATYTVTGSGTRVTELGSSGYDTYFTFNQPFALNRQGNVTIYGNATVTTGSGVTFNCNSSQSSYTTILNSGATLKLAGEGNMAVTTLNASNGTLDFSALSSRSAALPYITGTVQLGANTSIIVPEGTTSPYKIGSAVTGTYPGSITIGSKTYATTLSAGDNAGEIAWTINSATIDAAGTYTLEDLFTSTSTTGSYEIDVEESATLNVASAATIANLTLNVADGKTLTITGSDLTISGEIVLNGGTVAASSATALSGTVGGDGQFIYTAIPEGMTWTGSGWTGTLTLQDLTFENKLFSTYGNVGSTLELVGVQGYNNEMVNGSQTWVNPTVKFTDSETTGREFGFKYTGANSGSYFTFNIIAGTGKLVCVDNSTQTMRAGSYTDFSGSIDIGTHAFIFGTSSNTGDSGTITVPSGATLAVAAGETWTASNGFVVNGTLTIEDGATASGVFSGSGTVVANKVVPSTASTFTGTLTINGDGTSGTYCSETEIYGSRFNVAEGYVILTGDITTLPDSIDIQSGATLYFYECPATSLSLKMGTWNGMLYFYNCTALTTLTLDAGAKRSFSMTDDLTLPAGTLTTVNLVLDEVKGEGGTITLSNTAAISAIAGRTYNFTVNRLDGETVTGAYDSSASTISYVPSISGSATDLDWDFTDGVNDDFEQAPSGMGKSQDSALTFYTDAEDSTKTGVYIKHHPYTSGAASWFTSNSAAMTIAVVGTMPSAQNTIFLSFGSAYDEKYGLLIATTDHDNEVLIGYNYGGTVTPITTMTVPNASSSRHSYIVTKVDGATATTFTVYLDGTKWKTVTTDAATLGAASDVKVAFTGDSNNGIQVGSDYGGNIRRAGTYVAVDASTGDGVLNVLRAYGRVITQAEIDAYAAAFPYDSPSGKSTRTFTAASENWIDETENSAVWSNTKSGNASGTPDTGAQLEVTASAASAQTIAVNLASQASYESLLVEGSQTVTFQLADGYAGAIAPGKTTIKTPVIVKPGVLNLSGGPTFVEGDGHLTFDYSGYTMTGTSAIELTGEMDQNDSAVTITPPADQHYTYTYGYSGTQYVITPAVAVAVLNHNDTLTGYTTADAALAAAVSGDTVTLQTAYLTPSTEVATYTADKTGVNVIVQGYTIEPVVSEGTTTWTTPSYYIWTGEGADSNWTTPANWGLASGYPGSSGGVTTTPTDNVVIDAAATINVNATVYVWGITMNADVKFTSSNNGQFFLERTYGTGKMSLGGITLNVMRNGRSDRTYGKLVIENNVEVCDGTVNTITIYKASDNNYAQTATISGNLSGSGELRVDVSGTSGTGLYNYNRGLFLLGSDNSGFSGKFSVVGEADATGVVSGSADAEWSFNTYSRDGYAYATRGTGITEYYFGSLSGTLDLNGNSSSEVQKYNMTIHVGGKNEDCTFGGRMGRSDKGFPNTFIKEGTADCTYTGTEIGNLQLQNGTFIIGNSNALNSHTSLIFTGGALSVADGITVDPSSHFSSDSTAAVVFDDRGYDNEWVTALTATTAPYGLTKKGSGTLTLSAVPAYTGTTTVEAGVLEVPQGTTIAELALNGGKIAIALEGAVSDTTVLTVTSLADGTTLTADDIVLSDASTTLTLDTETTPGSVIVKATREVKNYVWTGTTSTAFDTLSNWLVNDAVPTEAPYAAIDTIEFPADGAPWTVALSEDVEIASVAVNGAVTLTGGKLLANAFTGSAAITLGGNAGIGDYEPSATMTIANPIVVSGTGNSLNANTVYVTYSGAISSADDTAELTLYGAVERVNLTGDNSGLQGTVYMNGSVTLENSNAGSANAKWVIANTPGYYANPIRANSVEFGELSGTYTHVPAANNKINYSMYVGALGTSFTLGGKFSDNNSGRADTIYKVGAGTMTFTGRYVNWLNLNEGTVYVTSTDATVVHNGVAFNGGVLQLASGVTQDFSGLVQSSTAAVKVGVDDGASLTWATALNANNTVAEIEKYGAGTLTLTYAPAWDSTKVTVAEGSLVMPDTATITYGDNTIVSTRDTENGTMTLAYATTVALTVPDVENATYVVTVDGEEVTGDNGVFNVPVGSSSVVVTYTGATGYTALNGVFTASINEATTLDTSAMTIASNATWTGEGDDDNWDTAGNWDTGVVPTQTTPVVFPAGDWTAVITGWGTAKCASMTVTGNLTLAQSTAGVDANDAGNPYNLDLYGSVAGEGTVTLSNAGIWNGSGDTITFQPSLVVAVSSSNEDSQLCGSQVVFNGEVDIQGRLWTKTSGHVFNGETTIQWLTADNARVVFNGDVTLNSGSYVDNYGGYGWQFNGVTVTALGSNGAVFYNGLETETSVTGSGVTFVGNFKFNTYENNSAANITAPVAFTKSATVQLANGGTISSYTTADGYEVVVSGSTLYTCQLASSAAPVIDTSVAAPVAVSGNDVTFTVAASSLKVGLWYRVKAVDADDVEVSECCTTKVQYNGENYDALNFTATLPSEGVVYYTIEASDAE